MIAEVDAEEAAVGLPVRCLAKARTNVDDVDRLKLLAGHAAAVVLSDPDDWQALTATVDLWGGGMQQQLRSSPWTSTSLC